jgi:predicted dithiol-disulfide oxidoreductase (DUF899 family)
MSNQAETEHPKIVSHEEWIAARKQLLTRDKEFTRLRDRLTQQRRELPWERVEKQYKFQGPGGELMLADLFYGRSQLIVHHFMCAPGSKEGCPICSFWADQYDGFVPHLAVRDVAFAAISRAPFADLEAFGKRMRWHFLWVSSFGTEFNYDHGVSFTKEQLSAGAARYNYGTQTVTTDELPGTSVFYKNAAGEIFHTYSSYARGLDDLFGFYHFIDLTPKGRNESELPFPMAWVRHRDRYSLHS